MRAWSPELVAAAAGVRLVAQPPVRRGHGTGPRRVTIDSRDAGPGDLFVGLPGTTVDGGRFAADALDAGAWGALVAPEHVAAALRGAPAVVLSSDDPLAALGALARSWRRALGARVVGITGSTGKTSTKDILAAMLAQQPGWRVVASPANHNTEIGLPLTVLAAPPGTDVLVLEMAMRGAGQIAELAAIAEPDVGVIVNVGPAHLELLGTLEAIAAAKAELLADLRPGAVAVLPAGEPLLDAHARADLRTVTFGAGGDVAELGDVELPFSSAHMLTNALAALAAARALGASPRGPVAVTLSALRGERIDLPGPVVVIDDCYNANPMSMRAAIADLCASAPARTVAVLGDMLELGPDAIAYHEQVGAHAQACGVDVLVAVGALGAHFAAGFGGELHRAGDAAAAAGLARAILRPGDTVLVKGSRGVGLEVVAQQLRAAAGEAA